MNPTAILNCRINIVISSLMVFIIICNLSYIDTSARSVVIAGALGWVCMIIQNTRILIRANKGDVK